MMTLCHPISGMSPLALSWPVVGGRAGEFGWSRTDRNGKPKFHRGVDFACDPGHPIFAGHDGKVTRGMPGPDYEQKQGHGFGQRIYLAGTRGEDSVLTIYAHLSGQNVVVGQEIRAGHLIGWAGRSGNITSEITHCHHEVRLGGIGQPDAVNPMWFYHGTRHDRLGIEHPGGN